VQDTIHTTSSFSAWGLLYKGFPPTPPQNEFYFEKQKVRPGVECHTFFANLSIFVEVVVLAISDRSTPLICPDYLT
jgi:hypothetical protein